MGTRPERRRLAAVLVAFLASATLIAACGGGGSPSLVPVDDDFAAIADAAQGQTVRWWMFGGDDRINEYVDEVVEPAAAKAGIELERVPVSDTADAVQRVVSQRRAGESDGGAVDLIWINGENFAAGKEIDLWLEGWVSRLPNARYVDFTDPSISRDLQVPIDDQESPWSRAAFVFAYDRARTPQPPESFDELLDYARQNPGRITYPAPPDFTGTSFVKQLVIAKGEEAAFDYLAELEPFMWKGGETFPKSEAELSELFANGQVDFAMSFDPSFVAGAVRKGEFAPTTRPFLLEGGALVNTSYVTIPADASSPEGAQVLANLLLEPRLQALKADPARLGIPSVLALDRLDSAQRRLLESTAESTYLLDSFGETKEELPADQVAPLEDRWKREILP
ncbi:MAG: ABC transporter substrate-binding protein [Solirubrobacterales bacterium]